MSPIRSVALPRFALLLLLWPLSLPAGEPVSKSRLGGIAIDGHDSVAYHDPKSVDANLATPGSKAYTFEWKDATWRFASEASRDAFAADPERYSPAYNGHCANALSLGEGLIRTDGSHWEIFDDRLYLFYAARGRDRWLGGDYMEFRAQADRAWAAILAENQ